MSDVSRSSQQLEVLPIDRLGSVKKSRTYSVRMSDDRHSNKKCCAVAVPIDRLGSLIEERTAYTMSLDSQVQVAADSLYTVEIH